MISREGFERSSDAVRSSERATQLRYTRGVDCAAHPGAVTRDACSVCQREACAECLAYDIDGVPACESCAMSADERSRAWGSSILALVGAGYLATLAVSYVVFGGRPFVGGIAAIVAMVFGRALQALMRAGRIGRR